MKKNAGGPAVSSTRLLDDLIIILSETVGELAVQEVDLHKGDVPGAKQRRRNAAERITAAMRLVKSMSNTKGRGTAMSATNAPIENTTANANSGCLRRLVRLSADDWSEVADLLGQCIDAADVDSSYTRRVRDQTIGMMKRVQTRAVDNGLRKKAKAGVEGRKPASERIA